MCCCFLLKGNLVDLFYLRIWEACWLHLLISPSSAQTPDPQISNVFEGRILCALNYGIPLVHFWGRIISLPILVIYIDTFFSSSVTCRILSHLFNYIISPPTHPPTHTHTLTHGYTYTLAHHKHIFSMLLDLKNSNNQRERKNKK